MSKKRILICGATGFIGRNVAERLAQREDCEVIGTYLNSEPYRYPGITLVKADLTRKEDVERVVRDVDIVVQTAAVTTGAKDVVTRPYIHVTDNVIMNTLILQAAFDQNIPRYIFTSCTVMYPPNLDRPVTEKDVDYDAIYDKYFGGAWMKLYVERLCEFYARLKRTKFTILRHSNMYGPHDKYDLDRSHVTSATITKVLTNTDGVLQVWGDGTEGRDLIYISDLVDFIEKAIDTPERSEYEIYNVGLGKATTIKELVEKVIVHSGRELKAAYDTTKPTIKTTVALDTAKARETFGWEPKVSLDEGILKTIEWYKKDLVP